MRVRARVGLGRVRGWVRVNPHPVWVGLTLRVKSTMVWTDVLLNTWS